jgi:hypothetical protein
MHNHRVSWLADASPSPIVFLGLGASTWTIITGVAAVLATVISIVVAVYSLRRVDRREHHRWLQEKRREAYVTFMTASRTAYDAILERGQKVGAPRLESDHPNPESDELKEYRTTIDRKFGELMRAQDILAIVGPGEMEELGKRLIARLTLDRTYYSPTGWSDRQVHKERILAQAEATGDIAFLTQLRASYTNASADVPAFWNAFHEHRLEAFWGNFNAKARDVLKRQEPSRD